MNTCLPGQNGYLDAYIRTAQYLSGMKTQQDIWAETGKILVSFFSAQWGAIGTMSPDGEVNIDHSTFSETFARDKVIDDGIREAVAEVLETGFLTMRTLADPPPLSIAFLPIAQESSTVAVMLVGHSTSARLPKELLNIYLAVAGLVSTTAERLAHERELRSHRLHLEQLVHDRTSDLTTSNKLLEQEIEERRKAEEALRYERDNLMSIFEAMEDHIYVVDADGSIVYGNSALERDFGPCAGHRCYEYLNGTEEPCAFCHLPEVLAGKTVHSERSFARTGKTYDVMETPLKYSEGVTKLTLFRDITHRKLAEEKLNRANRELSREVEARKSAEDELTRTVSLLKATLESTADGILVVDTKGRIVGYNERFKELWRIPEHVLLSQNDDVLLAYVRDEISNPEEFMEQVRNLYRHPEEESLDTLKFKDRRVFERYSRPQRVGSDVTGRVWSFRDITEQKRAEDALRRSRELLNAIVEGTSDAVIAKDSQLKFILFNSTAARLTGKNPDEALGRDEFLFFSNEEAQACIEMDRSLMTHPRTVTFEEKLVLGGERKIFLTTKGTLFDKEGSATGIFGISRDITDFKRMEEERLEMERRLLHSQKLESLGVLTGGIAHDFNNLLMVILGSLELTELKLPPHSPAQRNLQDAMKACETGSRLISQMLDYAGKGRFVLRSTDLNNLVHDNVSLFRTSIAKNVELVISTTPELPTINADEEQIRQVIMNLIINAAEAIGNGPGVITVGTGVVDCNDEYLNLSRVEEKPPAGRFVFLEVSDTGCGMNDETVARLFDPFFTTKFLGRGLGMSAVLGIVRTHGGAIFLESKAGKGTVFRILFPALGETASDLHETPVPQRRQENGGSWTGLVLVVDDEENVRELCMEILEYFGFTTIGAGDGAEALRIFSEHASEIGLVILDMTMPHMDGLTAFHALREIRSDVDVIISSGYSEENVAGRFGGDRPSGFIQKPFNVEALHQKISEVKSRSA